ncbi:hypothetical protein ACFQ4C_05755 [Larkinella insperata]|uniref:Outer membrane protein beta-barrel domain-containing protein n=1 Tax=Larkinella insperata TaxID=332158 RepID=A0ABW3Q4P0_9BACT|nr:hypothetical protein [Larkinella insperata]
MKTDKFEESIRKKLEDIEPPYRESNWLTLRSFLRRNGVPSIGLTTTQWLTPMLSAASVAGLIVLSVWQYRVNQQLEQTVESLKDTVNLLQQAPPVAAVPKPDTVYITREVPVPGLSPIAPHYRPDDRRLADRSDVDDRRMDRDESAPTHQTGPPSNREPSEPDHRLTESGQPPIGREVIEPAGRNTVPAYSRPRSSATNSSVTDNERYAGNSRYTNPRKDNDLKTDRAWPTETGMPGSNDPSGTGTTGSVPPGAGSRESVALSWNSVQNRIPSFDSSYYAENYQRRVRRICPLYTPSVINTVPQQTRQPAVEEPAPLVKFRLGGGAEIAGGQSGFGLVGEVLFGDHLTIGLGISRLNVTGDNFKSDQEYNKKRLSDFRRDFPGRVPVDPRIEVLNIHQSGQSWQLPVTISYRLPLGNTVAILPSAGLSFSLKAREEVEFMRRKGVGGYYDFYKTTFAQECEPSLYNSWQVSVGLEKQAGHWAFQALPYVSNPMLSTRNSLNQTTAGVRARVLYQF